MSDYVFNLYSKEFFNLEVKKIHYFCKVIAEISAKKKPTLMSAFKVSIQNIIGIGRYLSVNVLVNLQYCKQPSFLIG